MGLTLLDELKFRRWYSDISKAFGINPNPDDPRHFYDYRAAWQNGVEGPDEVTGHWPSQFKTIGHPRTFINGVDTRTGNKMTLQDYLSTAPMRPGLKDIFNTEK